jgi:hypothetical protein
MNFLSPLILFRRGVGRQLDGVSKEEKSVADGQQRATLTTNTNLDATSPRRL